MLILLEMNFKNLKIENNKKLYWKKRKIKKGKLYKNKKLKRK